MKEFKAVAVVVVAMAAVPLLGVSNVTLNFLIVALMIALAGQGWNVLGGYGGQYSFGHAAFFGTGAYVTAVLQVRYGVNAWIAFARNSDPNHKGIPHWPTYNKASREVMLFEVPAKVVSDPFASERKFMDRYQPVRTTANREG